LPPEPQSSDVGKRNRRGENSVTSRAGVTDGSHELMREKID
jgi:hypothetical protein